MRRTVLGLIVVAALLTGCGDDESPLLQEPPNPESTSSEDPTFTMPTIELPKVRARFVVVTPPGSEPISVVDQNDPAKTYAEDLKPGTVTDYVEVPYVMNLKTAGGVKLLPSMLDDNHKADRWTIVISAGADGPVSHDLEEKDGRIYRHQPDKPVPPGMSVLLGLNGGLKSAGGPEKKLSITLGKASGGCFDDLDNPEFTSTSMVTPDAGPVWWRAKSGAVGLRWYTDPDCRPARAASAAGTVQLADGQDAYVVPWQTDPKHVRYLVVPVTADQGGDAGVVDIANGPAYVHHE